MYLIGNESYDDEANESAFDAYSEFLDLQVEALDDSGDLDYFDKQFIQTSSTYLDSYDGFESAIAYDEALADIVHGRHSEEVKREIAAQYGITSNDVFDYQFSFEIEESYDDDATEELDELELWDLENEMYLFDREVFGYEHY